jgi:hypothetical protein
MRVENFEDLKKVMMHRAVPKETRLKPYLSGLLEISLL